MRTATRLKHGWEELRFVARGLLSTRHPILAQMIPIRRCNISCGYCNEYDSVSQPVPTETLFRWIDKLASFKTGVITFSGGEPLLHPDLEKLVEHVRQHRAIATLISNG